MANDIKLVHILLRNGISRIYVHYKRDAERKYDNDLTINRFCWIAPWAHEALMKFSYLELDCTLPILIPYVKCIPQISLPESSELYRLLYNELQYAIRKSNRLHEFPFLSDQGSSIIKF